MDKSPPVVVSRARTEGEASVIKSLFESYGIPCSYSSEIPGRFYPNPADCKGQIKIFVPASAAEEARLILGEHGDGMTDDGCEAIDNKDGL